ncbi:MAG TPA: carbohydrate-binding domain-containing protein [Micromonosporaceae bacterium]|nr:carbohydrate-binding domain-containing protein [Micromonosporaceae bacterium]
MTRRILLAALLAVATASTSVIIAKSASAEPAPNGYQYCVNAASDPDRDGWGWENSQSCVVRGGPADGAASGGGGGTAPNGFPYCASAASDPDGDGWGWENSRSCVVRAGSSGGGTGGSTGGSTASCPGSATCGSYTVGGLGARKRLIIAAGGDALDLAVAMLETDNMGTNYAYGDNKSGDAANFGVFKQNWHMLRNACSRFSGQSAASYGNGAVLNGNLAADVQCLNASQSYYGIDRWFAGHRNGETGLNNSNTADINRYRTAIYWIRDRINSNSANLTNDTRFWVNVPAI